MKNPKVFAKASGSTSSGLTVASRGGNQRMLLLIHLFTGVCVALIPFVSDHLVAIPNSLGRLRLIFPIAGFVLVAGGFLRQKTSLARLSASLCLILLSLAVVLALGEGVFRLVGFDFARQEEAWRRLPPGFRQPIVATGKVFFKREASERWVGRPMNTYIKSGMPNPYADEAPITIDYDRNGFRNPDALTSWKIVVAGDSFTELGYLPYSQLFTTILANSLNVPVLNLGTSYTGPLTQLSYLQDYGISSSTTDALVVFYEGNDLDDLSGEYDSLLRWNATGKREYREFQKQPSLLTFLYHSAYRVKRQIVSSAAPQERNIITAYFKSSRGNIPVTLAPSDAPPGRSQLSEQAMQQLQYFFSQYSALGREKHLTVWLAYMPTKLRVLHGRLEFSQPMLAKLPKLKKLETWEPSDLPNVIAELCHQYGIRYIDLTPALLRETERTGRLLYNSLYDTHLNQDGSRVVGAELARYLKSSIDAR